MWLDADRDEDARRADGGPLEDEAWDAGDDAWDADDAEWDPDDDAEDPGEWDPGDGGRDDRAYWRRRFFILCAGVGALGVCAWLFPGAQHAPARTAAARASASALAQGPALPPAAYGGAYSPPAPSPTPTPTATKAAKRAVVPKKLKKQKVSTEYQPGAASSTTAKTKAGAKAGPKAGAKSGQVQCAPSDIVLSLLTSQSSYATGVRPQFSVYAVSTAAAPCTLPYGAGSVRVVVTRHGRVVWDSAACQPAAAKPVRFTRGVPQVVTMIWNPKAAKPGGCGGALPASATGTLDAVAMSRGQTSPVHAFKVSG